jgi:hypothetical protein
VGVTAADIAAVGGSILDGGRAYLVGSLAQGFGNRGSDVDIYLFGDTVTSDTAPYLFFVGSVPVDVECFPQRRVADTIADLTVPTVGTACGPVALSAAPRGRNRLLLTRWTSAIPLDAAHGPLLGGHETTVIRAHLLRHCVEQTVLHAALAELVELAGGSADDLWRHSGRALLDLMCTARGYPPIGTKWLPARLRAARIPTAAVRRVGGIADATAWSAAMRDTAWDVGDPLALTRVAPTHQDEAVALGRRTMLVTRYSGLWERERLPDGTLRQAVDKTGAERLLALMRAGILRPVGDSAALTATATVGSMPAELVGGRA